MVADREVTAIFAKPTYTLTTQTSAGGTIAASPAGSTHDAGVTVNLTATTAPGYRFTGWTVNGVNRGTEPSLALIMDMDYLVVANFVGTSGPGGGLAYPLDLSATVGGTASAVPGGGPYAPNTRVTLSATPANGYVFIGWTIDGAPAGFANPYTLTMTAARSAVATFSPAQTLNLSYTSGGRVVASAATWAGDSPYPLGTVVTLEAITASNGVFTGWTIDGVFQGWATPLTLTMDRPHTVVATFAGRPRFGDLPPGPPPYEAITQLAARGIVRGYENGDFGPNDTTLRAQMAALIVRAMGWEGENRSESVQRSWRCGRWPLALGRHARGVRCGAWLRRWDLWHPRPRLADPDDRLHHPRDDPRRALGGSAGRSGALPGDSGSSGHREDLATFVYYAGAPPGTTLGGSWATWDTASSRAWFATALWHALDSYYNIDRTP